MKEFDVALQEVTGEEEDQALTFFLKDEPDIILTCYPPTEGQIAMVMANTGRGTSLATRIAGIVDFLVGVMDEESMNYLMERLNTRGPRMLRLLQIQDILEWMVEEWTGRPIQPSSGSSSSRANGGRKSTRPTSKRTSSVSQPTGS